MGMINLSLSLLGLIGASDLRGHLNSFCSAFCDELMLCDSSYCKNYETHKPAVCHGIYKTPEGTVCFHNEIKGGCVGYNIRDLDALSCHPRDVPNSEEFVTDDHWKKPVSNSTPQPQTQQRTQAVSKPRKTLPPKQQELPEYGHIDWTDDQKQFIKETIEKSVRRYYNYLMKLLQSKD
jgi:hypothetical protein